MSEKQTKKLVYEATEIISTGNKYGLTAEQISERTKGIPVYKASGEILFTNLSVNAKEVAEYNKTAEKKRKIPTNHSFSIMLSEDSDMKKVDKDLRSSFVELRNSQGEDDVENYKSIFKTVTRKDITENKFDEKYLGRTYATFGVSSRPAKDKLEENVIDDETGEVFDRQTALYFRLNDLLTGEEINPVVFKTDKDGNRSYTFTSPKTQKEENNYISSGDIVNLYIRPYEAQNSKTGEYTLKYNPLEIEIIQSAFERGAGNRKPREVATAPSTNVFGSVFGKVTQVSTPKAVASQNTTVAENPKTTKATTTPKTAKPVTDIQKALDDEFSDLGLGLE